MVRLLLISTLILSGCASKPVVTPCDPIIVKVPVSQPLDIPTVARPIMKSSNLDSTSTPDHAVKAIQSDIVELTEYSRALEMIIDNLRAQDVGTNN